MDPDPHGTHWSWSARSGSASGMRIRIQEGKNDLQKFKSKETSRFEVLDVLFWGLKSSVAWTSESQFLSAVHFFMLLSLNPYPELLGPDPHRNQCGSTTLDHRFFTEVPVPYLWSGKICHFYKGTSKKINLDKTVGSKYFFFYILTGAVFLMKYCQLSL